MTPYLNQSSPDDPPHVHPLPCSMKNSEVAQLKDEETLFYQEAFDMFDWNHSGTIPTSVRQGGRRRERGVFE